MLYDVIPCQTMSALCICFDCHITHTQGLPVIGLYVMHKGLPVMCKESVCHTPQLQS